MFLFIDSIQGGLLDFVTPAAAVAAAVEAAPLYQEDTVLADSLVGIAGHMVQASAVLPAVALVVGPAVGLVQAVPAAVA